MAGRFNKVICAILMVVMSFCTFSCDSRSADEILGNAASDFASGKETEAFDLPDTGKTLDDMIKKFAGSYYIPEEKKLTDDEYDDLVRRLFDPDYKRKNDKTEPTPTNTPIPTPTPVPEPTQTAKPTSESSSEQTSKPTRKPTSKPTRKVTSKPTNRPTKKPTKKPTRKPTSTTKPRVTSKPTKKPTIKPTAKPTAKVTPLGKTVNSMEDLYKVILEALKDTKTEVAFNYTNQFVNDYKNHLDEIYCELQRRDPLNVTGVKSWSWTYYGNKCAVQFNYSYDINEFIRMKRVTEQLVTEVVNKINPSGKSEYEIVCAVNNYLCDKVYYPPKEPYPPVTHTAYGALKNGCAVCEGYACAACLILRACGVESDIEVGDTKGGLHAWNLVKVKGNWYQLDVCWNDGGKRTQYLLVSDKFMRESRKWIASRYPKCPSKYAA